MLKRKVQSRSPIGGLYLPQFRIDLSDPRLLKDLKSATKRHPSVKDDVSDIFSTLENDPTAGNLGRWIPGLGAEVRKIRVGVAKQNLSPRKAYRLIYLVERDASLITPLFFHYKPEIELMPEQEIMKALKDLTSRRASKVEISA